MSKWAVLVEDDKEQIEFTRQILEEEGFELVVFESYKDLIDGIDGVERPVDLIVLDRRLPENPTDEASDDVGDRLLDELVDLLPDSPFVVFSGHTGFQHAQFVIRGRGVIDVGSPGVTIDRVFPFEKGQAPEFAQYVQQIAGHIDSLADIEIAGSAAASAVVGSISRRVLRRVARYFGGVSIRATPLRGGLTDLPIWQCTILDSDGNEVASVVVKQSDGSKTAPTGGLHTMLPASYVAAPVAVVSGLCDGKRAQVMQLAGAEPVSLLRLLDTDDRESARQLGLIADCMSGSLVGQAANRTIAELVEPLGEWSVLCSRLAESGLQCPRGTIIASTQISAQHGDLHPGNVLVVHDHPVLIDFDNESMASMVLDPVTALLSPLFHRESAIRSSNWPTVRQCELVGTADFLADCPIPEWMATAQSWMARSRTSEREQWALILGFVARQLKYSDVSSNRQLTERAMSFARAAIVALRE